MLVLLAAAALADDRVYLNESDELSSLGELERAGVIHGRTGRLLVRSDAPDTLRALPDVARVDVLPGGLLRVTPAAGVDDLALARALHARQDVTWAHPDLILPLRPATLPNDPWLANEWYLDNTGQSGVVGSDINAPVAWERATGEGITIAVLDSGVQLDHPDLSVIPGHDYVDDDDDPNGTAETDGGHGTCAAGIAAAVGDNGYGIAGVAWEADIYAIRVIGGETTTEDIYDAFVEAVDAGASVLSNSWGYSDGCEYIPKVSTFADMFNYAEDYGRGGLGAAVVFSAGNGGCDIEQDGMLDHKKLLVVAAVESTDVRAWYSSYGEYVDIAAPTSLLTTDLEGAGYGSYEGDDAFTDYFSGTSASAPVVSGVVALMMQANPRITAAQVRDVLCATATRVDIENAGYDEDGWSPYYGCGRIDAGAAVNAVANTAPLAPEPTHVRAEVPFGRVMVSWSEAADPDEDVRGYELSWWREGEDEAAAPVIAVAGTWLDLGEEPAIGETIAWKVRAVDPWGAGPWSATTQLTVVDGTPPAPEETGCAHVSGGFASLLGLLALRRR